MPAATKTVTTFPAVQLPSHSGGLPVEVVLIAQLGAGAGDALIAGAALRQRGHAAFIDALDEPSARIGGIDLARGDTTSLYTFVVGPDGHPFHRHAGHRMFTAVSGSAGARLRFSTASPAQIEADPAHFLRALRQVDIPPDCLFTVRFGGGTWHQFAPLRQSSAHPALFALSCHADEFGGDLPASLRERVAANEADIAMLTEVLPASLADMLGRIEAAHVPTVALALHEVPASHRARCRAWLRRFAGRLRSMGQAIRGARGFVTDTGVAELAAVPADSLLRQQFAERFDHEDSFVIVVEEAGFATRSARAIMAAVLEGFVDNRPRGVSRLMALRNGLVKPLGLRTSPLGCPVSSLLSPATQTFAGRFPVLAQRADADDARVEVVLGADDKHLAFRSCVGVERLADGRIAISLGTRVRTRNAFGRFYMAAIERVHRSYIAPAMLRLAVEHAMRAIGDASGAAAASRFGAVEPRL